MIKLLLTALLIPQLAAAARMTAKEGGATEEYIGDVAVDLDSATRLSGHIGPVTGVGFFHKGTKLL